MLTRVAKVGMIFDTPTRTGCTRFEAFFNAVDAESPRTFAATTFDPFAAGTLRDARVRNLDLWVTLSKDCTGGWELIRAEHAHYDN